MHDVRRPGRRLRGHDGGGPREQRRATSGPGRLLGVPRSPVRVLHAGHDNDYGPAPRTEQLAFAGRDSPRARRQSLPLHWLLTYCRRGRIRGQERTESEMSTTIEEPPKVEKAPKASERYFGRA